MPDGQSLLPALTDTFDKTVENAEAVLLHLRKLGCTHSKVVEYGQSRIIYGYALRKDRGARQDKAALAGRWYNLQSSEAPLIWSPRLPHPVPRATVIQHLH